MQKLLLLFLIVTSAVPIQAQKKVQQITYLGTFNTDLLFEELETKKEEAADDELIAADSLKAFLMQQLKPMEMTYTLTDSGIIMQQKGDPALSKTIYTYRPDSLDYKITEVDAHGVAKSTTLINKDYRKGPTWEVVYVVERKPDDRKQILGYDCYKIILTEKRVVLSSQEIISRKMEMYVTDKIKLPGYIIAGLYDNVIKECPLELVEIDVEALKPKTVLKATAVK